MSTRDRQEPRTGRREKEDAGRVALQCVASATGTFIGEALGPTLAGKLLTGVLGAAVGAFLTASGGRRHRRIVAVALLVALLNMFRRASDAIASEGRRAQSVWAPASWVVVGLTAVTGFAVGSGITTARDGWTEERSPSFASIPDVRGQPRESALRVLEDAGFRLTSSTEPSESIQAGDATRTDPRAGTRIGEDARVTLYVSTGPPLARVTIPNVAGQRRTRALSLLEDTGLRARSRRESSESIENGAATRTNPPAGAEVDSNSGVTLYLSSGPALAPATVPDVKGRSRAAALAILSMAGFRPTGATEPSKSVGEGIAIRTDPPAGAKVDRGAGVKLFVSSGSGTSTVELPDLSGHPAAEALAVLRDTGLRPLSAPEGSEFVREGVVTLTVPAAGASVEEGSDVTVFVSSGRPPGECEDGADNDDDGEIDGADPQCKQSHGQSESDVPGEG